MSIFLPSQDVRVARRRRMIVAAVVMTLLVIGFGWKPARDSFRRLHARKLAAEAEAYIAQNRTKEALEVITKAARTGNPTPRVLRLLLELNARTGSPEAYAAWARLARHPQLLHAERQELLRWAVAWGQVEAADAQWRELEKQRPLPAETIRLGASYFEMRGDAARAVGFARETLALKSDDIETRILLGRVLLRNGSPSDTAIGKRLLLEQAQRHDNLGLAVLRHLAGSRTLLPFEASQCLGFLERHPGREIRDELTAGEFRLQLTPYRREEIIESAARAFATGGGELVFAGRWLLSLKAYQKVLEILPADFLPESRDRTMCRLDALAELGRWSEIERSLADHPEAVEPFERALYLARAATELKQSRLAELQWKQAEQHAGKDARAFMRLAAYAKTARAWDAAERALRSLAQQTTFRRAAYQSLVQLFEAQPNPNKLRETLLEMKEVFPEEPAIQNDLAYLDLLQGREIEGAFGTAERLSRTHPDHVAFRATLALAHLRKGDHKQAQELLEGEAVDWTQALPGQQAVYAAVLGNAGDEERARNFCREIPIEVLKPEERALIAKWL